MENARALIIASGRVQGVGFRNFVYTNAVQLKLKGYTRNLPNGNVETIAEGKKSNIIQLYDTIKEGNSISFVQNAAIEWQELKNEFKEFTIKRL